MKILDRALTPVVPKLREGYPVLFITGPRESGKTTFARIAFDDLPYVNLESPIERANFQTDPIGFLDQFPDGAVLDEVQNVPEALSYLQVRVDQDGRLGRWVLTGSQQPALNREISQSLAGRVAHIELLPFSMAELGSAENEPRTLTEAVLRGGYPPLYDSDKKLEVVGWLEDYLSTFVSRDVRSVLAIRDRNAFDRFLRLCASNTAQVFEATTISRDIGIDAKTIWSWISVLEACYIVKLLRPHHRNFGKRITKRPKLYFLDSGLACRLLHIADVNQLRSHPLWGALAETWCVTEVLKARLHRRLAPSTWFWRSSDGYEVDLIIETGRGLIPIEIKSGSTPHLKYGATISKLRELSERTPETQVSPGFIIYGGEQDRPCGDDRFVPWRLIDHAIKDL